MKVFFLPQVSDRWWTVHRGIPSASNFDKIITPAKGDLSKQAEDYIDELISDVMCQTPNYFTERGHPINSYAIQRGVDLEPEARRWLAYDAGLDVTEVGFCVNEDFTLGCSPDGVIGLKFVEASTGDWCGESYFDATAEGVAELKVPLLKTHAGYLRRGILPVDYKPQAHGHLVVTGANFVEFVSYAREMPPLRIRVERDEYTDKVSKATKDFVGMYKAALEKVNQR